jgi:hypothetical protein
MKFEEFSIIFGIMAEYFGAQPSEGLTNIYFNAFESWEFKDFETACQSVINNRQYNGLPKIVEIEEALCGKTEDAAAIAWQSLMSTLKDHGYWDSVTFEDGAIGRSIEAMGGWVVVSGWSIEEWRMRKKEFDALYMANFRRENNDPIKLTGVFEINNAGEFEEFIPKSVKIKSQNKIKEPKLKLIRN